MPESVIQELAESRIGRLLNDKWRLESLLGVGGTAAVYAATHRNGARVAVKILHPAISASDEARLRFKREGYIVNRVEHPGVVRVLDDDVDEVDGSAFLVMDRADGVSLCERVMRRLLDENEVLEVTEQLLEILVAAHEKGVIHRDLKPDNLLVDEAGRVRLLDFGIARLMDDDANLTRTGFTFGTPAYMAPEQAMGRKALIGARTDVYAVGATMFTLLSGEYVQDAENSQELLIKIATQPARSLTDVRPESSPELVDLVDRATMMHLEDRWQSADAMLERVRHVMRARGLDGSRRHISSRISAMILPAFDESVHEAPTVAPPPAIEAEPFPLHAHDESNGDRSSVIRGLHGVPPVVAEAQSVSATTTTRPSLVRVRRKDRRRTFALASAAAVLLLAATFGWRSAPAGTAQAQAATVTTKAAIEASTPATEPVVASLPIEPSSKPEVAALSQPAVLAAPTIAPAANTASTAKKPPIKRPRRNIDVGY